MLPRPHNSRRSFLRHSTFAVAAGLVSTLPPALRRGSNRGSRLGGRSATRRGVDPSALRSEGPKDERFWFEVQQAFDIDRSIIHLNNGGVNPSPDTVVRSLRAHYSESNRYPFYAHRGNVASQVEAVRKQLADEFGCDADEIALTRNTSEGMEIVELGVALEPGDEVLTTTHDYPRILAALRQRADREGIVVKEVDVPVPLDDAEAFVRRMEAAMTRRTRLVVMCHLVDLTGQILPVRGVVDAAHRKGIPVLVDGAQTFGQFPFTQRDLGCDFFATSLHKWMMGPQGTGFLYIRRDLIPHVWPLIAPETEDVADIRKFEDVGTQSMAPLLAISDALAFSRSIGIDAKRDRLLQLRGMWHGEIGDHERVRLQTNLATACSLVTVDVDGIAPIELRNYLWDVHRIRVRPIDDRGVRGIRVSPGIYTSVNDLERFVGVMRQVLRDGLPS